jgi:hypothetical protein
MPEPTGAHAALRKMQENSAVLTGVLQQRLQQQLLESTQQQRQELGLSQQLGAVLELEENITGLSSVLQQQLQQQQLLESILQQQQQLGVSQQQAGPGGLGVLQSASGGVDVSSSSSSSGWPPLAHVSITGGCSVANLGKLLTNCPQLLQLALDGLGPLGDETATVLASRGRQLKVLQISGCSSMTVTGCNVLAAGLQQLQQLDLVDVSLPSDHLKVLLQGLGQGFGVQLHTGDSSSSGRQLRQLKIERCRGLTNDIINVSLVRLQHLQQLQLVACDNIQGDSALLRLVDVLPQLEVLKVVGCKGVADAAFARRWEAAAAARVRKQLGCRVVVQRVLWQA